MKVFLGGTCNRSTWRNKLINLLRIDYFNPVVDEWNEEAQKRELYKREHCDYCLYVITPRMKGVYSIAEVVDNSNKRPERTLFCYLANDDGLTFTEEQVKSLEAVKKLVEKNSVKCFRTLEEVAEFLNQQETR